jgi:putative DNA primase/helicase
MKCFGISFIDAVTRVSELLGIVELNFTPSKPKKDPSIYLNKIWNNSCYLLDRTPVSRYLLSRNIEILPNDVRYCPECWESDTKQNLQAMVARITSKDGKPIGLHVTYLKNYKKAVIESPKKIMTPTESLEGSAIRLTSVYEIMGIAEGIETALSCTKLFDIPTWSCMDAGKMEKWMPPEGCKKVVIYADNDLSFAGIRSAGVLANKLFSKGFSVEIKMPEEKGMDFNDVLMKGNL